FWGLEKMWVTGRRLIPSARYSACRFPVAFKGMSWHPWIFPATFQSVWPWRIRYSFILWLLQAEGIALRLVSVPVQIHPHGGSHIHRVQGHLHDVPDLILGHLHLRRQFLHGGLPAQLLCHHPGHLLEDVY